MDVKFAFSRLEDLEFDGIAGEIRLAQLFDFSASKFAGFAAEEIALLSSVVALGDELVQRLEVAIARPVVAGKVDRVKLDKALKSTIFDRAEAVEGEIEAAETLKSVNGGFFDEFDHVSRKVDVFHTRLEARRKGSKIVLAEIKLLEADQVAEDVVFEGLKEKLELIFSSKYAEEVIGRAIVNSISSGRFPNRAEYFRKCDKQHLPPSYLTRAFTLTQAALQTKPVRSRFNLFQVLLLFLRLLFTWSLSWLLSR